MRLELRAKWDTLTPRTKLIITVGGLFAVIVIPVVYMYIHSTIYSATITLTFAPKSAQVSIGGGGGRFGDNSVRPGKYEVVISKQGFATYKETVSVKDGETVSVEAALESNDSSTANWYNDHPEDYSIAQGIGDRKAARAAKQMEEKFPIIDILPLVGLYSSYRVDYGPSPTKSGAYAIFISYETEAYKQKAIEAVEAKGYYLSDYEVIYEQEPSATYGSVSVSGSGNLLSKGLSGGSVSLVEQQLVENYSTYRGSEVHTIVISDEVSHTISEDKNTDTYTASIQLDDTYTLNLTIIVKDYDHLLIKTANPDGSDSRTIYDGIS